MRESFKDSGQNGILLRIVSCLCESSMYRPIFSSIKWEKFKFNFQTRWRIFWAIMINWPSVFFFFFLNEGWRGKWSEKVLSMSGEVLIGTFIVYYGHRTTFIPIESHSYLNILCSFIWFMRLNSVCDFCPPLWHSIWVFFSHFNLLPFFALNVHESWQKSWKQDSTSVWIHTGLDVNKWNEKKIYEERKKICFVE